jgi:hypothetical protein
VNTAADTFETPRTRATNITVAIAMGLRDFIFLLLQKLYALGVE